MSACATDGCYENERDRSRILQDVELGQEFEMEESLWCFLRVLCLVRKQRDGIPALSPS